MTLLKSIAAAALATVAIAGVALAAAPTQLTIAPAAPTLGNTLTLDLGINQQIVQQGQELQTQMKQFGYDEDEADDWCLDKKQIRNGLIRANFDDIDFVHSLKQHRVRVEALYAGDGWVYSMQVDRCTGDVTVVTPIYAAADLD